MKTNLVICIDLKTKLKNEVLMKPGKNYPGILRREIPSEEFGFDDNRYTFTESMLWTSRRNPYFYRAKYITLTCRPDGSLRLNFRNIDLNSIDIDSFCMELMNEIRQGLKGLVER